MGKATKIEWCDHTFNPWVGCTKVSPACDHCYAERLATTRLGVDWGAHAERRRTAESTWKQPLAWNRRAKRDGVRRRVFCASLADVFDNQVPSSWRHDLWSLIATTSHLDWLLLTKRPQNIAKMLPPAWAYGVYDAWPWRNVWLGTTVENQAEAERRIPHLLSVRAAVHFLSCEPLLGPLRLHDIAHRDHGETCAIDALRGQWYYPGCGSVSSRTFGGKPRIDWVICGGESGPGARPMHPEWARSLRDQCAAVGVAFHFKQWGEWFPGEVDNLSDGNGWLAFPDEAHDPSADLWEGRWKHQVMDGSVGVLRVGKARAGRLLDGREHNDVPVPALREVV